MRAVGDEHDVALAGSVEVHDTIIGAEQRTRLVLTTCGVRTRFDRLEGVAAFAQDGPMMSCYSSLIVWI